MEKIREKHLVDKAKHRHNFINWISSSESVPKSRHQFLFQNHNIYATLRTQQKHAGK